MRHLMSGEVIQCFWKHLLVRDRISASIFSQIALGWFWRCLPDHLEIMVFVQLFFDEGFVP
jgi:hypothetical protein